MLVDLKCERCKRVIREIKPADLRQMDPNKESVCRSCVSIQAKVEKKATKLIEKVKSDLSIYLKDTHALIKEQMAGVQNEEEDG